MAYLRPARDADPVRLPPDIAFLLGFGVSHSALVDAAETAQRIGNDAVTTLIARGRLNEEAYYRALASTLGQPFLDDGFVLSPTRSAALVLRAGAAPLAGSPGGRLVAAPRGIAIARLIAPHSGARPLLAALTTPTLFRNAVLTQFGAEIAATASDDLARHRPDWSCRPGPRPLHLIGAVLAIALVLVAASLPMLPSLVLLAGLQALMIASLGFRLLAPVVAAPVAIRADELRLRDDELPTYTVLVALSREAKVLPRLIHSLAHLDYPREKLQIVFLIEADDAETGDALRAVPLPSRFETVVVPEGLPRTKPRALNVGLALARGDLLVVYDAEDVVETDQLRAAANRFAALPVRTACLQGRLVIDDTLDGRLKQLFALEYAGLFDVLLPALARWRMPIPLGGTSTHFRTAVLRRLHGWDSWNVTEDADLGIRLAIAGYDVGEFPSSTYEESPQNLRVWLRQRTRWLKGFLQTSVTHGRNPIRTLKQLGVLRGFCALTLLPGTVVSALLYPFVLVTTAADWLLPDAPTEHPVLAALTGAGSILVFIAGLAAMMVPAWIGARRRGFSFAAMVLWLPLHFLLVSAAAWLAVIELARHPHRWNKTEHGHSRSSRSGALHLRGAKTPRLRGISSAPPPFARAA